MTASHWYNLRAIFRDYVYAEMQYKHLENLGRKIGEQGGNIPIEEVKKTIQKVQPKKLDYLLKGFLKGYSQGHKFWKIQFVREQKKELKKTIGIKF